MNENIIAPEESKAKTPFGLKILSSADIPDENKRQNTKNRNARQNDCVLFHICPLS
jgi:hypothetical protein